MANFSCNCRNNCTFIAVIASIIIGVIAAFLNITAVITVGAPFLWVVFGIAVAYLGLTLLKADSFRTATSRGCLCSVLPVLLTGVLGSILTSVILLAIAFAATSVIGAIITGLLLLFFSLTITSTACLVSCAARCDDERIL